MNCINFKYFLLVACSNPPAGKNTKNVAESMDGSAVGVNYSYECLEEYKSSAAGLLSTCNSLGEWSLSSPECEPSKCRTYLYC